MAFLELIAPAGNFRTAIGKVLLLFISFLVIEKKLSAKICSYALAVSP